MQNRLNVTSVPSIIFLDIVAYSKKANNEQINMKDRLNAHIQSALEGIGENNRILLDTGDGAGIAIWDVEPQRPLYAAIAIRDAIVEENKTVENPMFVRFGIHSGPVTVTYDMNKRYNIVGDGINVTQRIMSFAGENQIMVSRSYYDNVFGIDTMLNDMLVYHGVNKDKHARQHEIYLLVSPDEHQKRLSTEKKWNKLFRSQSKKVNKISTRVNSIMVVVGVLSLLVGFVITWIVSPELLNFPLNSASSPSVTTEKKYIPPTNAPSKYSVGLTTEASSESIKKEEKATITKSIPSNLSTNHIPVKTQSNIKPALVAGSADDDPSDANLYDGGYLTKDETGQQVILYGEAAEEAKLRDAN